MNHRPVCNFLLSRLWRLGWWAWIQNMAPLLQDEPSLWPPIWKCSTAKRILIRGFGSIQIIENRWESICIACISIIYSTERVSGALGCERSLVRACKKGPITWCSIREIHHLSGIFVCTPPWNAISIAGKARTVFWFDIQWSFWANKVAAAFALSLSWRFLSSWHAVSQS